MQSKLCFSEIAGEGKQRIGERKHQSHTAMDLHVIIAHAKHTHVMHSLNMKHTHSILDMCSMDTLYCPDWFQAFGDMKLLGEHAGQHKGMI